jgi:hypothetical protein
LACTLLSHGDEPPAPDPAAEPIVEHVPVTPPAAPTVAVQVTNQVAALALPAAPPAESASIAPALLDWARTVADEHQRTHGQAIDQASLRTRLRISDPLAHAIHEHLTAKTEGTTAHVR